MKQLLGTYKAHVGHLHINGGAINTRYSVSFFKSFTNTICEIRAKSNWAGEISRPKSYGYALLANGDKYDQFKGCEIALRRAIKAIIAPDDWQDIDTLALLHGFEEYRIKKITKPFKVETPPDITTATYSATDTETYSAVDTGTQWVYTAAQDKARKKFNKEAT